MTILWMKLIFTRCVSSATDIDFGAACWRAKRSAAAAKFYLCSIPAAHYTVLWKNPYTNSGMSGPEETFVMLYQQECGCELSGSMV